MGRLLLEHLVRSSQLSLILALLISGYHPLNAMLMMPHAVSLILCCSELHSNNLFVL